MTKNIHSIRRRKTWTGFLYTVIGAISPFILSLIGILLVDEYDKINSFIFDGQVLLFAVGLLTSSFYVFWDEDNYQILKNSPYGATNLVRHLTFGVLILSSAMYAILYTLKISDPTKDINGCVTVIGSIIFFGFAVYATYCSVHINVAKFSPVIDVEKESKNQVKDILNEL